MKFPKPELPKFDIPFNIPGHKTLKQINRTESLSPIYASEVAKLPVCEKRRLMKAKNAAQVRAPVLKVPRRRPPTAQLLPLRRPEVVARAPEAPSPAGVRLRAVADSPFRVDVAVLHHDAVQVAHDGGHPVAARVVGAVVHARRR